MNTLSIIAIISAITMFVGIIGYGVDHRRYNCWRELTTRQIIFFAMATQAHVVIPVLFIIKAGT